MGGKASAAYLKTDNNTFLSRVVKLGKMKSLSTPALAHLAWLIVA